MGEVSKKIVEEYRAARDEGNYAVQAGILVSLLSSLMNGGAMAEVTRETAQAVLQINAET